MMAHTCNNELEMPNYEDKSILREKLFLSLSEGS